LRLLLRRGPRLRAPRDWWAVLVAAAAVVLEKLGVVAGVTLALVLGGARLMV
jgi:hypothetical protein